jgi:uncharacterized protein (TIGR03067 family)
MKTFLLLLMGTLLAAAAPETATTTASSAEDSAADLAKMQGNWVMNSMKSNGLKQPEEDVQATFRTVKDNTYVVSHFTREMVKGTFKLDATQTPKTIESVLASQRDGTPILGIYEFDDDKLRICNAPPGKPRPKEFDAKLGSQHTLVVWEREEM